MYLRNAKVAQIGTFHLYVHFLLSTTYQDTLGYCNPSVNFHVNTILMLKKSPSLPLLFDYYSKIYGCLRNNHYI